MWETGKKISDQYSQKPSTGTKTNNNKVENLIYKLIELIKPLKLRLNMRYQCICQLVTDRECKPNLISDSQIEVGTLKLSHR